LIRGFENTRREHLAGVEAAILVGQAILAGRHLRARVPSSSKPKKKRREAPEFAPDQTNFSGRIKKARGARKFGRRMGFS
jgi:hypothetical protein